MDESIMNTASLEDSHSGLTGASTVLYCVCLALKSHKTPGSPAGKCQPEEAYDTDEYSMAPLFENCSIVLELKTLPHKEKKRLTLTLTEHGGSISYVVNKQCSLVVASSVSSLSSNRLRSIQKHHTPVVAVDYVYSCVERGVRLPVDQYELDTSPSPLLPFSSQPVSNVTASTWGSEQSIAVNVVSQTTTAGRQGGTAIVVDQLRVDTENQSDVPAFPSDFQVAKYSIFEKAGNSMWSVVELHSATGEEGQRYRVVRKATGPKVSLDKVVLVSTSEEAVETYQSLRQELLEAGLTLTNTLHPQASVLVSAALKQLRLEENLNTRSVSQEVGVFVELLWRESQGCLINILKVPISRLSLNDVSRAEGLLLQIWKKVKENTFSDVSEIHSATEDFYTLLPHRENNKLLDNANIISHKLDLCQLIRDVLNVSEETSRCPSPSSLGKYRAMRCGIENVPPDSVEFKDVSNLLRHSNVQVQQILRVSRGAELHMFRKELGNVRLLLHASSPSSFVGILSRGLLLPTVGVKHHGIARTDIGNLGSGIYFSDSISTSLKYSKPSATDGSRLLLVCDVALGECRDLHRKDPSLCQAPEGCHSVHGVRRTPDTQSEFQDDEFVVYSTDQVKLRFVVQFTVEGDQLKEFNPKVDTASELPPHSTASTEILSDKDISWSSENPLDKVTAGLLDSSGQQLPLQAVHVKCKLIDLLSQVVIFQKYTNQSSVPIEAKYVFPLDDCAAVCGFEAFINGKHVVGQVKEKEQARKEYKQAVAKGHGAYLMDQDAPDVFTISVGNLPPGATVLIKVTFVSELIVRDGHVVFSLPGSVAPWQESAALNQTTQATVKKVCVTDLDTKGEFSLDMSIDMPYEITRLKCDSHKVRIKKTACKAVVSVVPGEVLGPDGFQLSIKLSQIHLPRMWVENHPDKDSQASMLVFYPDFEVSSSGHVGRDEVVLLLDSSESMRGEALHNARAIALKLLTDLLTGFSSRHWKTNVILFGTEHKDAFLTAQECKVSDSTQVKLCKFIQSHPPVGGSTELWRPLRALSLLPPSRGLRNLLLLSDGHIQNPDLTLRLVRDAAQHSRLFTCGLSPTANRHMLRALAQAGGGAYEFFDTKTKHTWSAKVSSQVRRMASPGCSSVSVKWQQFNPRAPPAVQAPAQLHALFNDCHTLVYGFVPHCTQASLHGNLSGQEINTMVSTSELQKTKGTFLHKLTARALIKDYEDGNLGSNEAEHEEKKAELKSFIVELSKEYSILSQFTSFVAIEERDPDRPQQEDFTDVHKLVSEEDVDFLPYLTYSEEGDLELLDYEEDEELLDYEEDEELLDYEEDVELMDYEEDVYDDVGVSSAGKPRVQLCVPAGRASRPVSGPAETLSSSSSSPDGFLDMVTDGSFAFGSEARELCQNRSPSTVSSSLFSNSATMYLSGSALFPPPPPPPPSSSYISPQGQVKGSLGDRYKPLTRSSCFPRAGIVLGYSPTRGSLFGLSSPPPPPPPPNVESLQTAIMETMTDGRAGEPRWGASSHRYYAPPLTLPPTMGAPPPPTPPSDRGAPQPFTCSFARRRAPKLPTPPSMGGQPPPTFLSAMGAPPHHTLLSAVGAPPPPTFLPAMGAPPHRTPLSAVGAPPPPTFLSDMGAPPPPTLLSAVGAPPPPTLLSAVGAPPPITTLALQTDILETMADGDAGEPRWGASSLRLHHAPPLTLLPRMGAPKLPTPPSHHGYRYASESVPAELECKSSRRVAAHSSMGEREDRPQQQQLRQQLRSSFLQPFGSSSAWGATPLSAMGAPQTITTLAQQSTFFASPMQMNLDMHGYASAICESVPAELLSKRPLCTSMGEGEDRPQQLKKHRRPQQLHKVLHEQQQQNVELNEKLMKWVSIFLKQHPEGYWECTAELGGFIRVDLHSFANVFLKNKGIFSLGVKARADILRLLATLLVLQLMRGEQLEEGKLLRSLFSLEEANPPQARPERWEAVKKAVDWACWADRQYPCVCSRLEMGWSWESSTRQLLGYDQPAPLSPFAGLTHWRLGAVGGRRSTCV